MLSRVSARTSVFLGCEIEVVQSYGIMCIGGLDRLLVQMIRAVLFPRAKKFKSEKTKKRVIFGYQNKKDQ